VRSPVSAAPAASPSERASLPGPLAQDKKGVFAPSFTVEVYFEPVLGESSPALPEPKSKKEDMAMWHGDDSDDGDDDDEEYDDDDDDDFVEEYDSSDEEDLAGVEGDEPADGLVASGAGGLVPHAPDAPPPDA